MNVFCATGSWYVFHVCFLSEVLYVKISALNKRLPISRDKSYSFVPWEILLRKEEEDLLMCTVIVPNQCGLSGSTSQVGDWMTPFLWSYSEWKI